MKEIIVKKDKIDEKLLTEKIRKWLSALSFSPEKILLIPPDFTRRYSFAGIIVRKLYKLLPETITVDIMPALGTHVPVTAEERKKFFGEEIPAERFIVHNWREDVEKIGEISSEYVEDISQGLVSFPIGVYVNKKIVSGEYDLIISIGQVVPHEVVGMANYNKNIFVGCGGPEIINKSHYLGAAYGLENLIGKDHSPVRKIFDYAAREFLEEIPLHYIMTVTSKIENEQQLHGLFMGKSRNIFEEAVSLSQEKNITYLKKAPSKMVVYLSPEEFKSTWLGNKAIYRTRKALQQGGDLIIIAPGIKRFGEDKAIDKIIRKYGYCGRKQILKYVEEDKEELLKNNLSAAAHLIHGSSDGKFNIHYATGGLNKEEIENAGYSYLPLEETIKKYNPEELEEGWNEIDGEKFYYISNPALGLWTS
ncbi:MAG: lactate racemase domain-containing protein [Halanaerobiales bacterium]